MEPLGHGGRLHLVVEQFLALGVFYGWSMGIISDSGT
jgi:hypothetical protein